MAEIIRGTNIADPIVPYTTADNIPTHYAKYGKGGFRTVNTFGELGQIPEMRLEPGMAVFVIDEQKTYQYLRISEPGVEPAVYDWKKGKLGGGGVEVIENWNELKPSEKEDLQHEGTIIYVVAGNEVNQQGEGIIYPNQFFYYSNGTWTEYGQIYVGPIEPKNKNSIWIDTTTNHYDENNEILYSIQKAVYNLQKQVSTLMTLRTNGVISGSIDDGERMELVHSSAPEKPRYKIIIEAESFMEKYIFLSNEDEKVLDIELLKEDFYNYVEISGDEEESELEYIKQANLVTLFNLMTLIQSYTTIFPESLTELVDCVKGFFVADPEIEGDSLLKDKIISQYSIFAPGFYPLLIECNNFDGVVYYLENLVESLTAANLILEKAAEFEHYIQIDETTGKVTIISSYIDVLKNLESTLTASVAARILNNIQTYILLHTEQGEDIVQSLKNFFGIDKLEEERSDEEIELLRKYETAVPGFSVLLSRSDTNIGTIVSRADLYSQPEFDEGTEEIAPSTSTEPTVKHISIKMGTSAQLKDNIKNFIPGELVFCTDESSLYIYIDGSLVAISGGNGTDIIGGDDIEMNEQTKQEIRNLIHEELIDPGVESIRFIPIGSKTAKYTAKVNENGELVVYNNELDNVQVQATGYQYDSSTNQEGIVINSFYLGGTDNDEHSYQPCSHNFVELANVYVDGNGKGKDINLNGYFLFYRTSLDNSWQRLDLWGTIPAGGTFLIRGAQCSVMDVNTTVIKVRSYDMEWQRVVSSTINEQGETIVKKEPIKFSRDNPMFYLCCGKYIKDDTGGGRWWFGKFEEEGSPGTSQQDQPPVGGPGSLWKSLGKDEEGNKIATVVDGYIDLVGLNLNSGLGGNLASENNPYVLKHPDGGAITEAKDVIFRRWYQLDPVTQSNPSGDYYLGKHNNVKYLTASYIEGGNLNEGTVQDLTPRASYEEKNIAIGKTLFAENYPSTLTCTFGVQATDNSEVLWLEETPVAEPDHSVENNIPNPNREENYNVGDTVKVNYSHYEYYELVENSGNRSWNQLEEIPENSDEISEVDNIPDSSNESYSIGDVIKIKITTSTEYYIVKGVTPKGIGATRCFCWNSVGYYDEYIEYRVKDTEDPWVRAYSISDKTEIEADDPLYSDFNKVVHGTPIIDYYKRVRWESAYGQAITTHRVILRGLTCRQGEEETIYEYRVGRENDPEYKSDTRTFVIRTDAKINRDGFNFVQTTDQQGANWEEYEVWNLSAKIIGSENWKFDGANNQPIPRDNFDFTINTGDICYNGSRSNEWIDYFEGYKYLKDKEEMLIVGNNDLAPISMRDIGNGKESPWKINVYVIDYFYTYEIDPENPQIFDGASSKKDGSKNTYKIPSLYSFNYGKYHFVGLISEIRTISNKVENGVETIMKKGNTVDGIFKIVDEHRSDNNGNPVAAASAIFDRVEEWLIRDLLKWKGQDLTDDKYWEESVREGNLNPSWKHRQKERYNPLIVDNCGDCILFTHEMPVNIISQPSYDKYDSGTSIPRETAKAYLNRFHNYEFQRLFKLWGIPMVMGGHKHTAAVTYPFYDAPANYIPGTTENGYIEDGDQYKEKGLMLGILNENGGSSYEDYMFPALSSFNPFIQVSPSILGTNDWASKINPFTNEIYNNSSVSVTINRHGISDSITIPSGGKYIAVKGDETVETGPDYNLHPRIRVEIVDTPKAPSYIMCQATGFKNKSNSDLAGDDIPWERFYVTGTSDASVVGQCYPFFTIFYVKNGIIDVKMYRIINMYGGTNLESQTRSKAGYWDLTGIYDSSKTLQENRDHVVENCYLGLFSPNTLINQ